MDIGAATKHARPLPPAARRKANHHASLSRSHSPAIAGDGSPQPPPSLQLSAEPASLQYEPQSQENFGGQTHMGAAGTTSTTQSLGGTTTPNEIPLEAVEKALEGLSREDLVMALKRAKEHMDQLDAHIERQTLSIESLHASANEAGRKLALAEAEAQSLQLAVAQREERVDELMREQERIEDEVYSKLGVVERLRKQLDDSERSRIEAEKRYEEQTATADKERQFYLDTEALLHSQKANSAAANERITAQNHQLQQEVERLQSQLARARSTSAVPSPYANELAQQAQQGRDGDGDGAAQDEAAGDAQDALEHDRDAPEGQFASTAKAPRQVAPLRPVRTLRDESLAQELDAARKELETLQRSHESLSASMQSLHNELRAVKAQNVELRDQNESYLDILQEKTLSGALIAESAVLNRRYAAATGSGSSSSGSGSGSGSGDGEEDEEEDGQGDRDDEDRDDVSDVPDEPRAKPTRPRARAHARKSHADRKREAERRRQQQQHVHDAPKSLANELEGVVERDGGKADDDASQQWKNHRQRERIENLSNDPEVLKKEVAELQDANQALTLYISKIIDRIIAREGYENVLASEADGKRSVRGTSSRLRSQRSKVTLLPRDGEPQDGRPAAATSEAESKQSKRLSGGLLGFGAVANASTPAKGSRRSASIDWRSWVPAAVGGGTPQPDPREAHLRPLALSPSTLSQPSFTPSPRRREVEDANDVAERERIRAHLSMQGIEPHQLPATHAAKLPPDTAGGGTGAAPTTTAGTRASIGTFLSRVIPGAALGGGLIASPTTPKTEAQALGGNSASSSSTTTTTAEPRLTTFDDPSPARPQPKKDDAARLRALNAGAGAGGLGIVAGASSGGAASTPSSGAANLTELGPRLARRHLGGRSAQSSSSGTADEGNSSLLGSVAGTDGVGSTSVAGDESYAYDDGGSSSARASSGSGGGSSGETVEEPGWRKALKRISLLGAETPLTASTATAGPEDSGQSGGSG